MHGAGRLRRGLLGWMGRVMDREEEQKRFCVSGWIKVGEMGEDTGWAERVWELVRGEK